MVWPYANLRCRSEACCTRLAEIQDAKSLQKSLSGHHRTTLSGYVFATKAPIDNRKQEGQHPLTGQRAANGQPVSRTQASDAMTSRLPRYEVTYVQCRCFQCGSVRLRSDIKGTELPPANILIRLERQLIALQLCRCQFLYNETLQQTLRSLLSKLSKRRQI